MCFEKLKTPEKEPVDPYRVDLRGIRSRQMMNDPRAARITGFVMSVFLLLGLTYLAFGESFGIKSPGPNARLQDGVQKASVR